MSLSTYIKKRNFKKTPEPKGKAKSKSKKLSFVIQRHDASHLHYDFRLELDGVLKSWAVPKGPSMNPKDKRLAVQVEDHPLSYGKFEGTIPEGNYGAGTVEIWDSGTYTPDPPTTANPVATLRKGLQSGSLKFTLHGKELKGSFALVRMKDGKDKNWLLIKHADEFALNGKNAKYPSASNGQTKKIPSVSSPRAKENKHPVFIGLRIGKNAKEVNHLERVMKTNAKKTGATKRKSPVQKKKQENEGGKEIRANGHIVKLTKLQKVFWPDEGYTKGDVIDYYNKVSSYILPHLKDRPQSLRRNPNGISDKGFFHKDAGDAAPEWVKHTKILSESTNKTVNYIICNDKATLLYLANLGCIELNPWNSTINNPTHPDYLILDIDPSEENTFKEVIDVALVIKEVLDKAGASSYCKTSGATGIHIYVPLHAAYTYEQARHFAELVATICSEQIPTIATVERSLEKRKGRIYIDYLQNSRGQTLSSVYSVRPVPGATVSTPLAWKEVKPDLDPRDFTIQTIYKRVEKIGDIFSGVLKDKTDLLRCINAIERSGVASL